MKNSGKAGWICGAAAIILAAAGMMWTMNGGKASDDTEVELVIGTYGEHLYRYSFDCQSLVFTEKGKAEATDPSYALSCGGDIFAVSETGSASGVYSFREDETVRMTADLRQTGADPCFLMLHENADGKRYLMTADYSGGSVSVFPVNDGILVDRVEQIRFEGSGPVTARQESSHIHQLKAVPSTDGYILASDLGADVIHILKAEEEDGMTLKHVNDIPCPPGSGPRHMEFGKDGKMLYCIAELSGNVLAYSVAHEDGCPEFRLIQQIQADEVNAGGSADIHIHPSGEWLYTSHRLDNDGIAIFGIKEDGTLEKTGYARTARHPRNFMITQDGCFLLAACRDDRLIQVFRIGTDGSLTLTPNTLQFESDMPSSITGLTRK